MQEGGTVDPVSGNDVPPGAMQEEVRDDIDAKLSEGEFVFPADVVRYIGLETLMRLRDKAKTGLKKMEEIGQMGNAEEVPNGEALHGEGEMDEESFSSEIDSIMGEEGEREYAEGGYVGGTENQQLYGNVPLKGFEMVAMTNDEGQVIYIPFINGVPQLTIPPGYKVKSATPTTPTPTTPAPTTGAKSESSGGGGSDATSPTNTGNSAGRVSINEQGEFVANTTNPLIGQVVGGLIGKAVLGPIGGLVFGQLAKAAINRSNFAAEQEAMFGNVAIKDSNSAINGAPTDAPTATTGKGGTGGAAASAAATAASAATAAGHSPAAVGAAAQAAADAVVSGKSATQAAQIAADIAAQVTSDIAATAAGGTTGPSSAAGVGVGSTTGINSMDAMSDAAAANNTTPSTPSDTSPSTTSDTSPSGPSGFGSDYGDTSMGGSSSFDSAYSYAQGGFVSKKKPTKASKPTSLVARRK